MNIFANFLLTQSSNYMLCGTRHKIAVRGRIAFADMNGTLI